MVAVLLLVWAFAAVDHIGSWRGDGAQLAAPRWSAPTRPWR